MRCWPVQAFLLISLAGFTARTPAEAAPDAAGPVPDEPTRPPEFKIDQNQVIRYDAEGKPLWSKKLEGTLGSVRPPHLLWDAKRVYVAHNKGVTALNAENGKALWHSEGPCSRMLLSKDLLVAIGSSQTRQNRDCWLMAHAVRDGATVFNVPVRLIGLGPVPVEEVAGFFVVQAHEVPGGLGDAWLLDRKGTVHHRLRRQVVAGVRKGEDVILVTSKDVVRLSPDDKVRWNIEFDQPEWMAGGGLLEIASDDMVAFLYGRISDSGVHVVRFTPWTGQVSWKAFCPGLHVKHSEYYHSATATVADDTLRVTSRGSLGTFVETLDLTTGRRLKRTVSKRE